MRERADIENKVLGGHQNRVRDLVEAGNHVSCGAGLECDPPPPTGLPPPLATPDSGPPLPPPKSSSLQAALGVEHVPPPAPTVLGSHWTWPACVAVPCSDLRDGPTADQSARFPGRWLFRTRATPTEPLPLTSRPRLVLPVSKHWNSSVSRWPTSADPPGPGILTTFGENQAVGTWL